MEFFGRTFFGLRFASAIIGALGIPAIYLLARTLYDRQTALIAAVLLAVLPPHLHFSRLALNNIGDGVAGTWAVALIVYGYMRQQRFAFLLGGMALGWTQYFHESGRLLFPPLVALWLGLGWLWWRPRLRLSQIGLVALTALIIGLPIYYMIYQRDLPLASRFELTGGDPYMLDRLGNTDERETYWHHHLLRVAGAYFVLPDSSLYYAGQEAMLLPILIPCFLLGLCTSLWYGRHPQQIVILWLVVGSVGISLIKDVNMTTRYNSLFTPIVICVALGLRYPARLLLPERWQPWVTGALVLWFSVTQVHYYFGDHLRDFNERSRPVADGTDAALRSVEFPPGTQIHILGERNGQYQEDILKFFADGLTITAHPVDFYTPGYFSLLPRNVDHAFFLLSDDKELLQMVHDYFATLPPEQTQNPDVRIGYTLYYAPVSIQ